MNNVIADGGPRLWNRFNGARDDGITARRSLTAYTCIRSEPSDPGRRPHYNCFLAVESEDPQ